MSEPIASLAVVEPLTDVPLPGVDGGARLSLGDAYGRLVLRMSPATAHPIGSALGLDLSLPVNRAATGESCAVLRLGPDEWLLLADAERDPWLSARITEAAAGAPVSLVDVSHRSVSLSLDGTRVEDVLAAGCPLPLDIETFPPDRATRTVLAKAEIVLWRRTAHRFHIEVARSFAPYVVSLIGQAIADDAAIAGLGRSRDPGL